MNTNNYLSYPIYYSTLQGQKKKTFKPKIRKEEIKKQQQPSPTPPQKKPKIIINYTKQEKHTI